MITKPMLAATLKDIRQLDYSRGYLATPKLNGIRGLIVDGNLVSRSFKSIRNTYIRTTLENILPEGADGEIVCPGGFRATTSGVMSEHGEPEFTYNMFDYVRDIEKPYKERMEDMAHWEADSKYTYINPLLPIEIIDCEHLIQFEEECVRAGFEGVILRVPDGLYKCGRATLKQEWLLKLKRFSDDEAVIVGFTEKMHNDNEAEKDNFGRTKRSSHKVNLRPANTLGSIMVRDIKTSIEFEIGTGFDSEQRKEIWENRGSWMGATIKYKHFGDSPIKEKPSPAVYLGARHKEDM